MLAPPTTAEKPSAPRWALPSLPTKKIRWKIVGAATILLAVAYLFWTQHPLPLRPAPGRHVRGFFSSDIETFDRHAVNNTVVIVPVNSGMLHFVENMLCSLSNVPSFEESSLVFWALDQGAKHALEAKGRPVYHDPRLFSVPSNENKFGNTEDYFHMMKERPKFFIDLLSAGYDMLMMDADIVFWQSPLNVIPHDDPTVDVVYSTDARDFYTTHNAFHDSRRRGGLFPPICNGFFWMRSTNETIALWTQMEDIFQGPAEETRKWREKGFTDDQRGMDVMLNDEGRAKIAEPLPEGITQDMLPEVNEHAKLNVRLLDQTEVTNGQLFMFKEETYLEKLAALKAAGKQRMLVHMNWDTGVKTKEDGAKEKNIWFWDGDEHDGRCKFPTTDA